MKTERTGIVQPGESSMDTSLQQLLTQADTDSTRGNNFQLKEERFVRCLEEILCSGSSKALEQVTQRNCGCPIPEGVQGCVGSGFEQSDLVKIVPACSGPGGKGVELDLL